MKIRGKCQIKGCNEKATGWFQTKRVCKYCLNKLKKAQKRKENGLEPKKPIPTWLIDKKALRLI